mmetsp:Transcript_45612/g.52530  ORF Transcript_45612/g.52530 Transcript_45612/m.52530 type:complete len:151 (+) Transcript_45612:2859-3311(+)
MTTGPPRGDASPRILYYDGICKFCHACVTFIHNRDPQNAIKIKPIQSASTSEKLLYNLPEDISTIILIDNSHRYDRSTAIAHCLYYMKFPWWPLYYLVKCFPLCVRDGAYGFVAKHRRKILGTRELEHDGDDDDRKGSDENGKGCNCKFE